MSAAAGPGQAALAAFGRRRSKRFETKLRAMTGTLEGKAPDSV
jgi:hypothetical protein